MSVFTAFVLYGKEIIDLDGSRTVKSIRNARWGIILQLSGLITKFITRTVFVRILGIDCNGLNGLFTEVISMISLAEMGVGTAIVYNLYKPLAENDTETVKRLMGLFKSAYRIIGISVFVIGLALTPFIHKIIKDVPFERGYIRIVFLLFVVQSASSYFFAYKRSLLNADQNNYAVSFVSSVFNVSLMVLSIAALVITRNYIVYLAVWIINTLASNVAISRYADRRYPFLKEKASATAEERRNVLANIKHIFVGTLSGKITSSTDNILISVLISTRLIGIYSNYSLVMNSIVNVLRSAAESVAGSIGNLIAVEEGSRVETVFRRISFMFYAAGLGTAVILYCVLTPFVKLWIGAESVIGNGVLFICVFNIFCFIAREPLWKFVTASGMFAMDKNISIAGSAANLFVSIIFGKLWGMAGIFVGTTCTLVIQIVLKVMLLYRGRIGRSCRGCLWGWFKISALTAAGMLLAGAICSFIGMKYLIAEIAVKLVVSAAVAAAIILVFYGRSEEMAYSFGFLKSMISKRSIKRG